MDSNQTAMICGKEDHSFTILQADMWEGRCTHIPNCYNMWEGWCTHIPNCYEMWEGRCTHTILQADNQWKLDVLKTEMGHVGICQFLSCEFQDWAYSEENVLVVNKCMLLQKECIKWGTFEAHLHSFLWKMSWGIKIMKCKSCLSCTSSCAFYLCGSLHKLDLEKESSLANW